MDIHDFVATYDTYQKNKGETIKMLGALQPLPIPTHIQVNITMDFIVGLPRERNRSMIMVVIECLSKYSLFCTLPHPFSPSSIAQIFLN
jgi:hypothetical protein